MFNFNKKRIDDILKGLREPTWKIPMNQEPTRECCDSPCHHCPYFINECKPCHSIKPPVEELLTEEKAREILGEKSNIDFKNHMSHYHCWQQNQPPACGQPLEDHKQCCLCSKIYKPRKKHE